MGQLLTKVIPVLGVGGAGAGHRAEWLNQQRGRTAVLYVARLRGLDKETFYTAGVTYSLHDLFGGQKSRTYEAEVLVQLGSQDAGAVYDLGERLRLAFAGYPHRPQQRFPNWPGRCFALAAPVPAWAKAEGKRAGLGPLRACGGVGREGWIAQQRGRRAVLYVVRVYSDTECFYKVGITFCLSSRFSRLKTLYRWRTVARYSSCSAGRVWDLEQRIHREFVRLAYRPLSPFSGFTECYSAVEEILAVLPPTTFFLKNTETLI